MSEVFDEALATYCATEGCGILIGYDNYKTASEYCSRCQAQRNRERHKRCAS